MPFIQEMVRVDLRIQVIEIPSQDVISHDNVSMKVDAVLYFNVVNPERAIIKVQHYLPATNMLAQTTLRAVLGQHELDEMLSERKKLSADVQSILDAQTETWGIKVSNVEIRTVELTENMVWAIAKQAEAERDRRAKVIHAEAEFQASQTLVNAAKILGSIPAAMQLRYLQTLTEIGTEQNSTVVFPMPIDIMKPFLAANYLSVGQIYLYANPLLREPLTLAHVKPLVVGHWGTTPGQNFIYVHLNRTIRLHDLDMIYIASPGHGGPALVANTYLEGSYSEIYPDVSQDEAGMKRLFKQFSFPGGISSHVDPTTPGSIHEGGELGYSLSHAFGAAFDNPALIVACIVGDGEAETGPLATAWQSNKFLDPITDGAVLPILHLNGFKISNPTILARVEHEELESFFRGCGWTPLFVVRVKSRKRCTGRWRRRSKKRSARSTQSRGAREKTRIPRDRGGL